jgi:hypothetical protein
MAGFDFANVNEKIGKLPIWAWGLIIGGAGLGFYYYKNHTSVAVPDSTSTTTTGANSVAGDSSSGYIYPGYDTGTYASNDGQTMPTTSDLSPVKNTGSSVTNTLDAWRASAINVANSGSNLSLTYSSNAIDKYLAGLPLDATQAGQVNKALDALGQAPGTSLTVKLVQAATAAVTTPSGAANSTPVNSTPTKTVPAPAATTPAKTTTTVKA